MAQKVAVALEDDLTGGPADETVRFAVDGTGYEIDLNAKNAAAFGTLLALSSTPARPGGRRAAGPGGRRPAGSARVISGPGRRSMGWRSVSVAVSLPAWPSSTTPQAAGVDIPRADTRCAAANASPGRRQIRAISRQATMETYAGRPPAHRPG
jgi:Lsr2